MLEGVVMTLVGNNLPWRLINTRREPTEDMNKHMLGIYNRFKDKPDDSTGCYVVFVNTLHLYESSFWDVNKYKTWLQEYYDNNSQQKTNGKKVLTF
jgi:hypothetical protein